MRNVSWACFILGFCFVFFVRMPVEGKEAIIKSQRPSSTWASKSSTIFTSGKSVAVVVAISNYIGTRAKGYPALPSAERDSDKMVDFLINEAGFDTVYLLTDSSATKSEINRLMTDVLPSVLGPQDRFLFYWSGHGDQLTIGTKSFGFLPLADSKVREFSAMVSMQDLQRWDGYLDIRQSLFVLDACLSGLAGVESKDFKEVRLQQLTLPARHLLTAGRATESVISGDRWGGSLFTDSFIKGARGEANNSFGVVSVYSLLSFIQERVIVEAQLVNWGKSLSPQLRNLQGGDGAFFFTPAQPPVRSAIPNADFERNAKREESAVAVVPTPSIVVPKAATPQPSSIVPKVSMPRLSSVIESSAIRGDEYQKVRDVRTIESCANFCTQDSKCKAFSYWSNSICYLFDRKFDLYRTGASRVGYPER